MSHPARLSLRAPPHLPFIQGWPGIPSSSTRKPPAIHGTLEVRIGAVAVKARWIRVELRKFEALPPGFPTAAQGETWDHVGEICTVWSASNGKDWDNLEQADFKFFLPLPENIPPTLETIKNTGVRYELVAALCYRLKGGVFKKESAPIMKISEPIRIIKHELHSAWPLYNIPDSQTASIAKGELTLTVARPSTAFGPTDTVVVTATLHSKRAQPFRVQGFECHLYEIITAIPPRPDPKASKTKRNRASSQPFAKTRVIASAREVVMANVGRGGEKSARLRVTPPVEELKMTLNHARTLRVEYVMEVKAVCDGGVPEFKVPRLYYVVGPLPTAAAQQVVKDIGHVEALCPLVPGAPGPPQNRSSPPHGPPGQQQPIPNDFQPPFPPAQMAPYAINGVPPGQNAPKPYTPGSQPSQNSTPVQGFVSNDNWRRKSSGTSSDTHTTTPTPIQGTQGTPLQNRASTGRPNTANPAGSVNFPTPTQFTPIKSETPAQPAPTSSPMLSSGSHERSSQSHGTQGSGDKRFSTYSTGTSATFGKWDRDLRTAIVSGDSAGSTPTHQATRQATAIGSSGTPTAGASTSSPPQPQTARWPSSEQEKMKLYNEARTRAIVAQSASGASLNTIGMDGPPPEYEAPAPGSPLYVPKEGETPSIAATMASGSSSAVANGASSGSTSNPTNSPNLVETSAVQNQASSSTTNPTHLSAAEEKEQQRKRFEEASNRVASGSSVVPNGTDASSTGGPSGSSEAAVATPIMAAGPSNAPRGGASAAPPSAMSEKEQMKRFYEAQDRVAWTRQSLSPKADGPSSTPGPSDASASLAKPIQSSMTNQASSSHSLSSMSQPDVTPSKSTGPANSTLGTSSPTPALSEKEQMRRYYEAQDRVAQARGESSAGPSKLANVVSSSPILPDASNSAATVSTPSKPSASNNEPDKSTPGSASHLSAAEEKEAMRKRFEAAQAAVDRNRNATPGPSTTRNNVISSSSPPDSNGTGNPSGRESSRDTPNGLTTSPLARGVLTNASNSPASPMTKNSAPPTGPPPPLPVKPPMDYINLLSPVSDGPTSFSRLAIGGNGGESEDEARKPNGVVNGISQHASR